MAEGAYFGGNRSQVAWEYGRLLSYLSAQAVQHGSDEFDIPFDRQQLADYLNADRSALSNELGKMQRDGLISFRKNHFVLHRGSTEP